jgi:hypothetical protein
MFADDNKCVIIQCGAGAPSRIKEDAGYGARRVNHPWIIRKSFLVLFFKKELLASAYFITQRGLRPQTRVADMA